MNTKHEGAIFSSSRPRRSLRFVFFFIRLPVTRNQKKSITSLSADLRDSLNNPLQEIVAMVSVAKHKAEQSKLDDEALSVITRAAQDMAEEVMKLEEKMLGALDKTLPD